MHDPTQGSTLCPECFRDYGLRIMAKAVASPGEGRCLNCGSDSALRLNVEALHSLAHAFFVRGSIARMDYGGAPVIQFNESQTGTLEPEGTLAADVELLQRTLRVGFFHYGPRLWMLGRITPLEELQDETTRAAIVSRIIEQYPATTLGTDQIFYRVRKAPDEPSHACEYDAPPIQFSGTGRLDATDKPILYASQDLEICVHESRFTAEDDLYVATLKPTSPLKVIDLSVILKEDDTEFESLDLAVLMLFLAGKVSYEITRYIAVRLAEAGYDGLIYPSYFSTLRTGSIPFETVYGLSLRKMPNSVGYEQSKIIPNLALFGRPIADGKIEVRNINRLLINRVGYVMSFGPVKY